MILGLGHKLITCHIKIIFLIQFCSVIQPFPYIVLSLFLQYSIKKSFAIKTFHQKGIDIDVSSFFTPFSVIIAKNILDIKTLISYRG